MAIRSLHGLSANFTLTPPLSKPPRYGPDHRLRHQLVIVISVEVRVRVRVRVMVRLRIRLRDRVGLYLTPQTTQLADHVISSPLPEELAQLLSCFTLFNTVDLFGMFCFCMLLTVSSAISSI